MGLAVARALGFMQAAAAALVVMLALAMALALSPAQDLALVLGLELLEELDVLQRREGEDVREARKGGTFSTKSDDAQDEPGGRNSARLEHRRHNPDIECEVDESSRSGNVKCCKSVLVVSWVVCCRRW